MKIARDLLAAHVLFLQIIATLGGSRTAIKARGRNKRDGGGDRDEAAEERGTETG